MTRNGLSIALSQFEDLKILSTAADAATGIELCRRQKPEIVLLDLHLPGSTGPKSTVELFCKECTQSKLVVYSAENRMAFVQAVLKAGAFGYLLKSEPPERLISAIRTVARGERNHPVLSRELLVDHKRFSKAEQHILQLLAQGKKYKDIAAARGTSVSTVRSQCDFLQLSLELQSREELIAWAVNNGFGGL